MRRWFRFLPAGVLLTVGVLLGLYGLFAILSGGDSATGDTYVTFFGHELTPMAGALVLALFSGLLAVRFMGRRKTGL